MKEAKPARYLVERRGTPDPDASEYYVLDVVHDFQARAQLRGLVRAYRLHGSSVAADELEQLLNDTDAAFVASVHARQEALAKAAKAQGKTVRRRR